MWGQSDGTSGWCCPEKEAQRGGSGISPSELATEGEERSVRSSRTPSGGAEAGIECCRCLPDWHSLRVALPEGAWCCTRLCRGA